MTANTCSAPGCTASPKDDHYALHKAPDEALAATPRDWPSYDRNQAELTRRLKRRRML